MLENRLFILKENDVISEPIYQYLLNIIKYLKQEFLNQENQLETFITHFAICLKRTEEGKELEEFNGQTWNEIVHCDQYEKANILLNELLKNSPSEVSMTEKKFLILHLCNLYQNERIHLN